MLFKEKLLLSNCDSVRRLNESELRKRFLTALTFADGVVIPPNTLMDNINFSSLITRKNVVKYLNEEGLGKFIIRGFRVGDNGFSLYEYFDSLPDDFIISSFPNNPTKNELTKEQLHTLLTRITLTQNAINQIQPKTEKLILTPDSLTDEIMKRLSDNAATTALFNSAEAQKDFIKQSQPCVSRSQWYALSDDYFRNEDTIKSDKFKSEIIDPAYNSLFALQGEGFLQDDIKIINDIPEIFLDSGIVIKSLRKEIEYIEYPIKIFELISTLGTGELFKFFTDEALDYIEDKLEDRGINYFSRKNWFGMYTLMRDKIGLEIK